MLHIMPGKLEIGMYKTPYLVECTFLEMENVQSVAQARIAVLCKFWQHYDSSLLQVLMSDTVSYRLSCGKILKN